MNTGEQIEKVKRQLGLTDDKQDLILSDLFEGVLSAALSICNRKEPTDSMLKIARDTTIAEYRKRGGEGTTGYSTGQQSYSYTDNNKELFDRLITAGQRVFRV